MSDDMIDFAFYAGRRHPNDYIALLGEPLALPPPRAECVRYLLSNNGKPIKRISFDDVMMVTGWSPELIPTQPGSLFSDHQAGQESRSFCCEALPKKELIAQPWYQHRQRLQAAFFELLANRYLTPQIHHISDLISPASLATSIPDDPIADVDYFSTAVNYQNQAMVANIISIQTKRLLTAIARGDSWRPSMPSIGSLPRPSQS